MDIEQADQIFDVLNANLDYADLALVLSEEERDEILAYYRQVGHYARINWTPMRVRNVQRALKIEDLIKADRPHPAADALEARGCVPARRSRARRASTRSRNCSLRKTFSLMTGSESSATTHR